MIELQVSKKIFNPVYLSHLNNQHRTQIFFGGSSSGKSVFICQRAVLDVASGDRNYLVVRNTKSTIRNSIFNEISKAISSLKLSDYFSINKTDMVMTCVNGYQIIFAGLDDVEKIKSITPKVGVITDILIEEATETEYKDVKQLYKRLRGKSKVPKRMTMAFNPILQDHWIYKEYFGGWQDNKAYYEDDKLSILKTTYKDNKFLEPDDIYDLEHETDPYFYNIYTLGNWGILGNVIFKNWHVEDLAEIRKIADKFKNGLDFGFAKDPAAMPHTYYDKTRKTIYVLDELYMTELTNDVLAREIKKIIDNQYVICDSAEPKSIRELRQHGVKALAAKKGPDSVEFGIQWLQQQNIVINVHCQNTKNEFQKYKWKEDKNGNALPIPVDRDNHIIDALRYAYEDEFMERRDKNYSGKGARN